MGVATTLLEIKEHIMFPEIDYDEATQYLGNGHHRLHQCQVRDSARI